MTAEDRGSSKPRKAVLTLIDFQAGGRVHADKELISLEKAYRPSPDGGPMHSVLLRPVAPDDDTDPMDGSQ